MIESYIEDGAQKVSEHMLWKIDYGSLPGLGETEKLIYELAELW